MQGLQNDTMQITKLLQKKAPFPELNTDRRKSMSESIGDELGMILRAHLDEQLQKSGEYKLFNMWLIQFNKNGAGNKYNHKSPDATCAANRWLKTNWNGDFIIYEDFSRFFGVIAGEREYHNVLMQLQEHAIRQLPPGHPLTVASNITFMLQLMFAHVLTYCIKNTVTVNGFGVFSKKKSNKRFSLDFQIHEIRTKRPRSASTTETKEEKPV